MKVSRGAHRRLSCQGPHCLRGACREEDDDHERQAAFLHASGFARAQVSRPALRLGGHAQSLSARPAGTFRSGEEGLWITLGERRGKYHIGNVCKVDLTGLCSIRYLSLTLSTVCVPPSSPHPEPPTPPLSSTCLFKQCSCFHINFYDLRFEEGFSLLGVACLWKMFFRS